jgi:hypothetical protein
VSEVAPTYGRNSWGILCDWFFKVTAQTTAQREAAEREGLNSRPLIAEPAVG